MIDQFPEDYLDEDELEDSLHTNCPCCGRDYDEIDYEYQICHICKHDANTNASPQDG